jgi:serine/threonine-protein kinase
MSPEQARGAPVDKRTDFWSLGVVLYEMVTRRAPFTGDTPAEVIAAILGKEPPPLGNYAVHAPGEFQEIVTKALRKDPAERYQSANEMLEELKGLRRKLELTAELERAAARHPWLRWTRSPAALALVLFIATLALALPFYWHRNLTTSSPPEKSIVVLPFENAVHDPDTEYLSDGLAEALINSLTELQQLKVIARSTAFRYKGKQVDPQGVGRELNVRTVLMGVVRQAGDRLNVQVDLVDAMTGAQLWGQEYERKLADVLAVKQALVREVTEKLRLKLTGEQQQRLTQHDTANPDAFQFYLRGRYYWNKRTADNLTKAMEQFRQAVDKDPNYALAYVGLGDSYVLLEVYAGTPASETLPKAKAFAERALQLDSSLAEAHTSLGYVYNGLWRWKEAEEEFKRAIELNPNYPTAHHWYSLCLLDVGRIDEATKTTERAGRAQDHYERNAMQKLRAKGFL